MTCSSSPRHHHRVSPSSHRHNRQVQAPPIFSKLQTHPLQTHPTNLPRRFRGSVKPARKCTGTNNPDSACESTTSFIEQTKPETLLPTHGRTGSMGNFGHNASTREKNTPSPPEFDFLSVAYDPDNVNMGFAVRSWVTGPERKSGSWWRRVRGTAVKKT